MKIKVEKRTEGRSLAGPFSAKVDFALPYDCYAEKGLPIVMRPFAQFSLAKQVAPSASLYEAFGICVTETEVTVYASHPRALFYALHTLPSLETDDGFPTGEYLSYPDFALRGVIEGFYGNPWTMDERRRLLSALARQGMNAYFYGPKDDPLHRDRWDELYEDNSDTLTTLRAIAEENHLSFHYMLAPGLSIRYSSEEDHEKLRAKYAQVYSFGVRHFGLLLDDLESATLHKEDQERFPRQVDAHIDLANRVYAMLKEINPENTLIVCPTQYYGDVHVPYITALGQGIPKDCALFFTGSRICSDRLTVAEAAAFAKSTGHKPVYWDNYPVNDMEMVDELHIMPLSGREAGLHAVCDGLVANPMETAEASLLPLLTVADYLWDTEGYNPSESFQKAAEAVLGKEYAADAAVFAELCYRSCLNGNGFHFRFTSPHQNHPVFDELEKTGQLAPVKAFLEDAKASLAHLRSCPNTKFLQECARFLDAAEAFCQSALALWQGDDKELRAYLYRGEDVMKYEARQLLDLFAKGNIA
jgi:hypothetical protein